MKAEELRLNERRGLRLAVPSMPGFVALAVVEAFQVLSDRRRVIRFPAARLAAFASALETGGDGESVDLAPALRLLVFGTFDADGGFELSELGTDGGVRRAIRFAGFAWRMAAARWAGGLALWAEEQGREEGTA